MGVLLEMHERLASDVGSTIAPRFPVVPQNPSAPVVKTNRWIVSRDDVMGGVQKLSKTYDFDDSFQRNMFVSELFSYEERTQHRADISIRNNEDSPMFTVAVTLWTRNIGQVTNLDKEYAAYADSIYREVMYNLMNESI